MSFPNDNGVVDHLVNDTPKIPIIIYKCKHECAYILNSTRILWCGMYLDQVGSLENDLEYTLEVLYGRLLSICFRGNLHVQKMNVTQIPPYLDHQCLEITRSLPLCLCSCKQA